MATTKPLTDAITALITYANGVTAASDTTLSDAVRTLADGYGGGGGESGTISVTVDTLTNLTITVSALYTHLLLVDTDMRSDTSLTDAPYGKKHTVLQCFDSETGYYLAGGINSAGTGYFAELKGIGRWGNNTEWNNQCEFTASSIKVINPRLGGVGYPWINGHTLKWYAW